MLLENIGLASRLREMKDLIWIGPQTFNSKIIIQLKAIFHQHHQCPQLSPQDIDNNMGGKFKNIEAIQMLPKVIKKKDVT